MSMNPPGSEPPGDDTPPPGQGFPPPGGPGGYPPPGGGGGYPPPGGPGGYPPPGGGGYPPPPGGFPPGYGTRGTGNLDVAAAISYGWNRFWKNPVPFILAGLVIAAVQIALNALGTRGGTFSSLVVSGLAMAVSFLAAYPFYRAGLDVVDGRDPQPFNFDRLGAYVVPAILYGLASWVGVLACFVGLIVVAVLFGFFGFAAIDGSGEGAGALSRSFELVKPQLGNVAVFGLAFFAINLVGALLCGIGLLFSTGITAIAGAHAYRQLSGGPIAA